MQVAADVAERDQLGQLAARARPQLAAVLAQLGRDVLHAEQLVDLLLGGAGVGHALVVDHAVLGHVEAALHGRRAQRLVVLARAGEVLEQVAEVLRLARSAGRSGSPLWVTAFTPAAAWCWTSPISGSAANACGQRLGVGGGGDDVEVLAGLGPAPRAARQLDPLGRRVLAQRRDERVGHGQRLRQQQPRLARSSAPASSAIRTFSSAFGPKPGHVAQALLLDRLAQVVERRDPELVEAACARAWARSPGSRVTSTRPGRVLRLQLLGRGDRRPCRAASRASPRASCRSRAAASPCPARVISSTDAVGLADRLRRVAVGEHAVDDRAVELVEVGELVEVKGDLGVAHRALGYAAACPPPGSYCPPTTRPRTSSGSCAPPFPSSPRRRPSSTSWWWTTARPTARARSPTGSPRSSAQVEVLHRTAKEGLGRAYLAGFERALASGAELVLEMDADFSHDPADLPRLIEAADDADLVLGSRYVRGGGVTDWGLVRRLLSRGGSWYAGCARRAGARPDRRLQVLPPRDARGDRLPGHRTPTATASRSS